MAWHLLHLIFKRVVDRVSDKVASAATGFCFLHGRQQLRLEFRGFVIVDPAMVEGSQKNLRFFNRAQAPWEQSIVLRGQWQREKLTQE